MIFMPDKAGEAAECAECGSITFKAYVRPVTGRRAKITAVECVICGDLTTFVPSPSEEFN